MLHEDNSGSYYGAGYDLKILHDGTNSVIKHIPDANHLLIQGDSIKLQDYDNAHNYITCAQDGAVELYHDNVKNLATAGNGIYLYASEGGDCTLGMAADEGDDNADFWRLAARADGEWRIESYAAGAWETRLSLAPSDDGPLQVAVADGGIANGGVSLASTNIGGKSYATGDSTASHMLYYNPSNGNVGSIKTVGTATQFNTSSDYRLKENEVPLENAITKLKGLKPYTFNFKKAPSEKVDGFYAHEAAEVVPLAVTGTKDEMAPTYYEKGDTIPEGKKVGDWTGEYSDTEINPQGVDYGKFTPLLTKALQEAIAKIETLETKVAALEAG